MSGLKQSLTLSTQKEIKIKICTPSEGRTRKTIQSTSF